MSQSVKQSLYPYDVTEVVTRLKTPEGDIVKDMRVVTCAGFDLSGDFQVLSILEVDDKSIWMRCHTKYGLDAVRLGHGGSKSETAQVDHAWFHDWLKSGSTYNMQEPVFTAAFQSLQKQRRTADRSTSTNATETAHLPEIKMVYDAAFEGLQYLRTSAENASRLTVSHLEMLEALNGLTDDQETAVKTFSTLPKHYRDADTTFQSAAQAEETELARKAFNEAPPVIEDVTIQSLPQLTKILRSETVKPRKK